MTTIKADLILSQFIKRHPSLKITKD